MWRDKADDDGQNKLLQTNDWVEILSHIINCINLVWGSWNKYFLVEEISTIYHNLKTCIFVVSNRTRTTSKTPVAWDFNYSFILLIIMDLWIALCSGKMADCDGLRSTFRGPLRKNKWTVFWGKNTIHTKSEQKNEEEHSESQFYHPEETNIIIANWLAENYPFDKMIFSKAQGPE